MNTNPLVFLPTKTFFGREGFLETAGIPGKKTRRGEGRPKGGGSTAGFEADRKVLAVHTEDQRRGKGGEYPHFCCTTRTFQVLVFLVFREIIGTVEGNRCSQDTFGKTRRFHFMDNVRCRSVRILRVYTPPSWRHAPMCVPPNSTTSARGPRGSVPIVAVCVRGTPSP